jgi:hypothetical protein
MQVLKGPYVTQVEFADEDGLPLTSPAAAAPAPSAADEAPLPAPAEPDPAEEPGEPTAVTPDFSSE